MAGMHMLWSFEIYVDATIDVKTSPQLICNSRKGFPLHFAHICEQFIMEQCILKPAIAEHEAYLGAS